MTFAVEALGRKEQTVAEITEVLTNRGFGDPELGEVIESLAVAGLLDDEHFAGRYAEDKRELSGWGPDRIRGALARKGVERELIDAAVAETQADQLERATLLLERPGTDLTDAAGRARALGILARRGFDSEVAHQAIRAAERDRRAA